ncbi:uncharacterized protein BDW43DRAFT_314713 [Aspergillus alliaceus]|uniref:uncharacterized protein n=1 Tax=Petromyces alliaceus TaxID=209559 RepID=UPI0012A3F0B0|nr:uncharacterized protein BDW43DRAFT_314713 [Aspergillus alliaceus]KAB8229677.1 hypothetical protein BDW43DRAFT_314713 [Aspergillus alliaceus]
MFGIRALRLAEKAVHQLHTPMAFTEAQTWGPLELLGAGVACDMAAAVWATKPCAPAAPSRVLGVASFCKTFPRSRARSRAPHCQTSKSWTTTWRTHNRSKTPRIYYLRGVVHNHADHVSVQFLSQFAAATGPESRLLIHETLAPELNPTKNITRFDLSMFASFGGAQSSKAEHKALLEKVGLEVSGTRSTPREWSIMEARLKRE